MWNSTTKLYQEQYVYFWGNNFIHRCNLPSMTHPTCYFEVSIHSMSLIQNQTLIQTLPVDVFPILYYAYVAFYRKEKIFDSRIVYLLALQLFQSKRQARHYLANCSPSFVADEANPRISIFSITSIAPEGTLGSSNTAMGVGTRIQPDFCMDLRLANSPSNIFLD